MRCISPVFIKDKFLRHDRKGVNVPCGKCNYCLATKRSQWSLRLRRELWKCDSAVFLTLTYSEDHIPINSLGLPELRKDEFQKFMKRLRKAAKKSKLRYYAVGEYGSKTERPHYHVILFNLPLDDFRVVEKAWPVGHCHFGTVTDASIHYVTKYVIQKEIKYEGREPPFL